MNDYVLKTEYERMRRLAEEQQNQHLSALLKIAGLRTAIRQHEDATRARLDNIANSGFHGEPIVAPSEADLALWRVIKEKAE